jgi:hypothetical protein
MFPDNRNATVYRKYIWYNGEGLAKGKEERRVVA